jgi:hypothetical protein
MPPRTIFIIRHGEKPGTPPPYGVDAGGNQDHHSLIPVGWQRAGGLAALFAPPGGPTRAGILTPGQLISPDYPHSTKIHHERTYETISALAGLLGLTIENPYPEGSEAELATTLAAVSTGVTLVCWEHHAIPTIANAIIPLAAGTTIPQTWPGDRFDVVWSFAWDDDAGCYVFSQIPELLLAGDQPTTISP